METSTVKKLIVLLVLKGLTPGLKKNSCVSGTGGKGEMGAEWWREGEVVGLNVSAAPPAC